MLKFNDNPPVRPSDVASIGEIDGDWYVAHTKARNEKIFAWELLRKNVAHFFPMVEKLTFSGGRKRRNMTGVFPGYVFFCGDGTSRTTASKPTGSARSSPSVIRRR